MDLMIGLTAISQALDITRKLKDFENDLNNAEFKIQIADLYMALSSAKIALADTNQLLAEREAEIYRLKNHASNKMRTVSYRGYNFGIDEDGKSIGRPFCPVCEKKDDMQIQITRATSKHSLCPSCKAVYSSNGYPWKLPDDFDISTKLS